VLARRIIPGLDVRDGRVVKGTNFQGLRDMADPVDMAKFYNESGADELVFYDITASAEGRSLFTDILRRVAGEIFIPLTVGERVVIFGGGHCALALAPVLRSVGFRVAVFDDRRSFADPARFPEAETVVCHAYTDIAGGLALTPEDCAVVEDARAGIQAARAGGMTALALFGSARGCGLEDYDLTSFHNLLQILP